MKVLIKTWLLILIITYLSLIGYLLLYYILISIKKREILNDHFLKSLPKEPFVSIIVPTYNEENNIVECLKSLRALDYSNYEIILSDGNSQDKTIELAKPYVDKIVVEEELPDGWIGKNYGCHLGAEVAEGELLLFTDADTRHKPDSLRICVSTLLKEKAGLFSMLPYQEIKKWWESVIPVFFFMSHLASGGTKKVNDPKEDESFVAIGQYLLFNREAYDKIGGHVRIKGSIVEDYAFGRVVKKQLRSLYYSSGNRLVQVQMYPESLNHYWTGFKKALYAGTKLTPPKTVTIVIVFAMASIFTPVILALAVIFTNTIVWPIIIASVYVSILIVFATFWHNKGKHYWLTYLFLPLLMLIFIITMTASALELLISKKTTWKGRVYEPDLNAGMNEYIEVVDTKPKVVDKGVT